MSTFQLTSIECASGRSSLTPGKKNFVVYGNYWDGENEAERRLIHVAENYTEAVLTADSVARAIRFTGQPKPYIDRNSFERALEDTLGMVRA